METIDIKEALKQNIGVVEELIAPFGIFKQDIGFYRGNIDEITGNRVVRIDGNSSTGMPEPGSSILISFSHYEQDTKKETGVQLLMTAFSKRLYIRNKWYAEWNGWQLVNCQTV